MRIGMTGATGMIGTKLVPMLLESGHRLLAVSRRPKSSSNDQLTWLAGDPTQAGDWLDELAGCDAVIHLAGENLFAKRWSPTFKQQCWDSRVQSTRLIAEAMAKLPRCADGKAKTFICGSAIGYYPTDPEAEFTEDSAPGNGWLNQLSLAWEGAAGAAQDAGVRVAKIRTGIVLDPAGGALQKFLFPFQMFVGGPLGSGKQWMSWIHLGDLCRMVQWLLDHPELSGVWNGVAPHPVRNRDFCKTLGRVMKRPSWLPAPRWALRIVLGEVVQVVCDSQKVLPERVLQSGFQYAFPELEPALRDLLIVKNPL
ncbi:multidrug mfs transporter : NAD binding domain of 6-phosphogluconate dehydrogenase family protein OS=Lyngbya aestuarii BL J GN=M595_1117 PE=4 SV=1: NAD_binding_10: DUF1731 [Tuwongella immobilis]|uniref:TIGR01777 family protein n=2 Tax=Tuwongella immobilis TaxID=692036 RepID=A0A6C2YQF6_9BACT|nr:multidrug mfs transporter : NAD binding domain of 6-phosphogluconate dehydrogenase family protein OS=Lyngbya aestuarii BL J GN=M595_1117 PE=4 SV=1: NAD_binding_10: DUF1731 [Tuwongella immobilis]VTS04170.1 multidrug mfs transporter : NAD binding domain of 6-phosphogluconate dehydrogenase family protein OS=Lyngbya aestuarii BL J GN=M595_1117 PE=4 SV=1: NAD_binding_10: DUF1731 [Tuwongella immobilis]